MQPRIDVARHDKDGSKLTRSVMPVVTVIPATVVAPVFPPGRRIGTGRDGGIGRGRRSWTRTVIAALITEHWTAVRVS